MSQEDEAVVQKLNETIDTVHGLDPAVFKSRSLHRALEYKLGMVLNRVEREAYAEALDMLENDILPKVNGCAANESADRNDWIIDCPAQAQVYSLVVEAIGQMDILVP